jgi:hypothetical protein
MRDSGCALVLLALASYGCGTPRARGPVTPEFIGRTSSLTTRVQPGEAHAVGKKRVADAMLRLPSGSFREKPAPFSERVVGEEAGGLIMEYRLDDDEGARVLRAHVDHNGEVTRVLRVSGHGAEPGTLADYEALLAGARVGSDENQGVSARKHAACSVGPSELDCLTKTHRVRLGEREAALEISQTAAAPDRDVGAEITAANGSVIYRATLSEHGNDRRTGNATVELRRPSPTHTR